ncbi:MAG TPA: cation diffusion facilitator family transporter [Ohtaekwangia sp.]|uniref:cation diffusion facilitator family transporter n=1 Tax=Ohtaekwangia sp. TaxID=2066019 RepID=UPI002F929DD2
MDTNKGLKSTLIGIIVSAILAIIKGVGGIAGNSYALIADAIESMTDIVTSGMLWLGLKWSARPADTEHPYGHGKGEALISVGIGLGLVAAAILIAVKSIENIATPHKTPELFTLIILVAVILTKEILYRFVLKTGKEINSGAVEADAFHHRSDAITSAAAFIGISIGLIGGKGYENADDYAALFASAIILFNAYKIIRPAIGELLDEELDMELNKKVREIAAQVDKVLFVQKCAIRKMGVFKIADLHVWVNKNLTVEEGHNIAHRVKDAIQLAYPYFIDVMIHIEPASEEVMAKASSSNQKHLHDDQNHRHDVR